MEPSYPILSDEDLIQYKDLIFNLSFKMTRHYEDAADITQEVLIKVITRLGSFRQESSLKTWVYRIAVNHILNYQKSAALKQTSAFKQFGDTLDGAPDADISAGEYYEADKALLYEETKQTCMSGMLLCLDKRHRMAFLLGELFALNDKEGSQVLEVTPENFRMMLSRAKRDLYNFMHDKCGLVNTANPCRCAKKTKAFIAAGFVNPKSLRFASRHLKTIRDEVGHRQEELDNLLQNEYRQLFLQHTYLPGPDFQKSLADLLASGPINRIFK